MMYFILTFFLGSAVGSFINVLIDRSIAGEDWVRGRSHCDHCKKELKWFDLIPIFSFIAYGGKSRCCRTSLSFQYPIVEIMVGLLFAWWVIMGFWFFRLVMAPLSVIQPLFWLIIGVILMILALADLFYGVVMMPIVWIGSIAVICYRLILLNFAVYQVIDFWYSILTGIALYIFFWSLYKVTKGRGMAEGDMYVALFMGFLLGWPRGMIAMGLSFIYGAIVGVGLIVSKLRTRKDTLPFVPFMVAAIITTLLYGEVIIGFLS